MFKISLLFICWLLVVGTSIYFTTTGLDISYPGKAVLGPFTDVELLGFALCAGQYAAIHAGLTLFSKPGFRNRAIATTALVLALVLSFSNILFSYVGISHKATSATIQATTSDNSLQLIRDQIDSLRETRQSLQATVDAIPASHSTNRQKQQAVIQPELTSINNRIAELNAKLYDKTEASTAIKTEASGANSVNEAFGWLGIPPAKLIAAILAISMEPLAIVLMMLLSSYSDILVVERKAKTPKRAFLSEPKRFPLTRPSTSPLPTLDTTVDVEVAYHDEQPIQIQSVRLRKP